MIQINNLCKSYGNLKVLEGISLTIEDGDIYGLVGRSGAGKSTLLRCINGLEKYQSGSLMVDGQEVNQVAEKDLNSFRRGIGMIFQHFSLQERKTVYENVALPLRCWHYSKADTEIRVKELLEIVGIPEKTNEKARNLSGGQKQRVAIARSLALNPSILLCDEATSALDPKTTQAILALLKEINEKLDITVVIVTHQMEVIQQICNRMSIIENSKIAESDTVKNMFFRQPPAFQRLLGEERESTSASGIELKILFSTDAESHNFLTAMAVDLQLPFPILEGKMVKCGDSMMGSFIINVEEEHLPEVANYLDQHQVSWKNI
ncbi:MAG: methionine ABC transporter ATP-binding protein [Firmicutes bacterium]|nr:methionine ABC transporter ATP-binding protein [Bacillota bacterium]